MVLLSSELKERKLRNPIYINIGIQSRAAQTINPHPRSV